MKLAEYARYDGLGLAELVRARQISAQELGLLFLAAVEKVNPQINAVIETYPERVAALDPHMAPHGPFAGVPFLLKDIGSAEAGKRQEMGSRLMRGSVAAVDGFLTQRFREAGLTILGRSTTPEFALSASTESVLTGATRNPWSPRLSAGGSSGGSAASVAAGILPLAHASDGAGVSPAARWRPRASPACRRSLCSAARCATPPRCWMPSRIRCRATHL